MNSKLLAGFAGGALAVALAAGFIATSSGSSAQPSTAAQAAQATAVPPAQATPVTPPAQPGGPGLGGPGPWGPGHGGPGRGGPPEGGLIQATADVTGLQPQAVVQELRAGKSLAQIAQEHGKTADAVVAAARTKLQERLNQAVTDGKITQERADQQLANFDQAAAQLMNATNLGRQPKPRGGPRQGFAPGLIEATAEVTGLQPQDIRQELQAGKSLAQIAQEHGKTADDILAKLREYGEQHLNESLDRAREQIQQPGLRPASPNAPAPDAPAPDASLNQQS